MDNSPKKQPAITLNIVAAPLYWLLELTFGLRGVAFALILCEIFIVLFVVPASFHAADERPLEVLKTIISPLSIIRLIGPLFFGNRLREGSLRQD